MATVIGIFDSGLGGLRVARALGDALPGTDMIYLGDTGRFPYGGRRAARIAACVDQGIRFLADRGATLIVLACVAGSAAWLRRSGGTSSVPVVDAVTSSVERLGQFPRCRRIGIIGTEAAVRDGVFDELIKQRHPEARVYARATPLLVPLIENGWEGRPETRMIVKKYLHPLKTRRVDALVMGCSYYSPARDLIQRKIGKRTLVVDSSAGVSAYAEKLLRSRVQEEGAGGAQATRTYYLTEITGGTASAGKKMFGRNLSFQDCTLA